MKINISFLIIILISSLQMSFANKFTEHPNTKYETTKEVKELYRKLANLSQKNYILFGQEDCTAYGVDWKSESNRSDVKDVCGYHPALYGWDVGGIELGDTQNLDCVAFDEIRMLIKEAHKRGGVNTISWHLHNPVTEKNSWDTEEGSVDEILEGGAFHAKFNLYLDRLAEFLSTLKTDDGTFIPIIFRPWHEHTGNWFWWGAKRCTAEAYIKLWQHTVDYLTNEKKLKHLLFAYSTDRVNSMEEYFERYPGDSYIDILGMDLYHRGGADTSKKFVNDANSLLTDISKEAKQRGKISAFTETGLKTVNQPNWWTEVLLQSIKDTGIAYVLIWRNPVGKAMHCFGPYKGHENNVNFIKFVNIPNIITEKNINILHK